MFTRNSKRSGSLALQPLAASFRCAAAGLLFPAALAVCASQAHAQVTATETVINSFTGGADGIAPQAALIVGPDGNFYGTDIAGGANEAGAVYQVNETNDPGAVDGLYIFGGTGLRGTGGPLLLDSDGNFYGTGTGGSGNLGVVFRLTPGGAAQILYTFTGETEGEYSQAGLTQGSDGAFYGTTAPLYNPPAGQEQNSGTIFRVTSTGDFSVLHTFAGNGDDLSNSTGHLLSGSDGAFYGVTPLGGANGDGTVFRITAAGDFSIIHTFSGSDGSRPSGALVQDGEGNFYGTTEAGGANGFGTVFKLTPAGVLTTLHSFGNFPDGQQPGTGLVQGRDGALYGTTFYGGANGQNDGGGYGMVFRITRAGAYQSLYNFQGKAGPNDNDGTSPAAPLLLAPDGSFYGTTFYGGDNNFGTIFKLTLNTPPAFFDGQILLPDGIDYLSFADGNYFGYYSFLADPNYLYHFDLGYEYVFDASDGKAGVYLYDFASSTFFYTSPSFPFPYLYDFTLNTVLYYYPDPNNPGHYNTDGYRFFYDFATGKVITK